MKCLGINAIWVSFLSLILCEGWDTFVSLKSTELETDSNVE